MRMTAIRGGNFERVLSEIWSAVPPAEEPSDPQQETAGAVTPAVELNRGPGTGL